VDTIARLRADQTAAAVDTERLTAMEKTWQSELAGPAQARAAREALAANPLVSRLREQLAEQETQLAGLRLKYTDEHRAVKDAQRAIEQTRTRLQEETSKALANKICWLGRFLAREASSKEPIIEPVPDADIKRP